MNRPIAFSLAFFASFSFAAEIPVPTWKHLSTRKGDLPAPNGGIQQTTGFAFDIDGDGIVDLVMGERTQAPSLVWMRRTAKGWDKYVIDDAFGRPEAGGVAYDVDADGDADLIVGGDGQNNELWWYENPRPNFDPAVPWKRHLIKKGWGNAHHDQAMADFKGTRKPQLMFWNQGAKKLLLAEPPANPREAESWSVTEIFDYTKYETKVAPLPAAPGAPPAAPRIQTIKQEGMAVCDIDGDGRPDLIAGMFWFKHIKENEFKAIRFAEHPGRVAAGWFKPGKLPQIVLASGDGDGPLLFFECKGDPTGPAAWVGRDLLGTKVIHGHSLDLGDINGDGHLDIFCAEMGQWTNKAGAPPDDPNCRAWILYGDGQGNFTTTVLSTGIGYHEARVADLDGDGRLDIYNKPYRFDTPRVDVWLNLGNGPAAPKGNFAGALSMELWTYREELKRDLVSTLSTIRRLGFTDVETSNYYGRTPAAFRQVLDQAGLTCSSIVAQYALLLKSPDAVAADAKTLGATQVVVSQIPRQGALTLEDVTRAAADFNRFGAALQKHGLRFAYHPHGFEFVRTASGTLFDDLLRLTDPRYVDFQMDVFWFFHGGGDPVAYLEKHPARFTTLHLKDLRKGEPSGVTTGRAPNQTSVALGIGQLDFPAILRAAAKAGVKRYYVEDESPYAPQQVPVTQAYLRAVRF
ncbi:MAG: VCBS repeat-containing protein [Verrucomicrobia bacterium]|nr:VCBS repeat-containing protein [Verrucomicrobiota bacterium]